MDWLTDIKNWPEDRDSYNIIGEIEKRSYYLSPCSEWLSQAARMCVEALAMIQPWKAFNQLKELHLMWENVSKQVFKKMACQSGSSWKARGQHVTAIRQHQDQQMPR